MARDETKPVEIRYGRLGESVSFKLRNIDEDELRAFIVALWLVLDGDVSRRDMIHELAHYHESPNARPPDVAMVIADAYQKARG